MVQLVLVNVIEGTWWQTTLHGEGVVYHENIGMTYFILTRSSVWIAIKPCKCDWRSILPKVEDVDDWLTLCKVLFNPYLLGEARLHDDVDVKEAFNRVLWKTTCTPTAYALAFRDFVESWSPFF
jgi:hypothetical protein